MIPKIETFKEISPMCYAYTTPEIARHDGWTKIGYTEKQTVEDRIKQQTHTADVRWKLEWQDFAKYKDGTGRYFTDYDFHGYLTRQESIEREPGTEWFHITGPESLLLFNKFALNGVPTENLGYQLRDEQSDAVRMTQDYFDAGGEEMLWNAKPRFGKTLSTYDLICRCGFKKVLIVTNRPSIANSWASDFFKFINCLGQYCFVSENDSISTVPGVMSRQEYVEYISTHKDAKGMIAFESLQGLKGSVYFGGPYRKLEWMAKSYVDGYGKVQKGMEFDLLVVDEAQEGVDTLKTEIAFRNINRKYTLYLSGTPFRQLASGKFEREQIFNWTYADEQYKKEHWEGDGHNPYESLPKLELFTYQMSPMIYDTLSQGIDLTGEGDFVNYAFDLNEFFITNESGRFVHENDVKKFLRALTTQEKYPFSTPELRSELSHTLWILNRVASAKALMRVLQSEEFSDIFGEYKIVLAAGDGTIGTEKETMDAYNKVVKAIKENDKTITLSVGQLTVGVTIPEWSGVLMLCNMTSPSSYMQAAFRAQNPCSRVVDGKCYRKETAYVFDFDPVRTLTIFSDFALNLDPDLSQGRGTVEERKKAIEELLNFFPVIGEDSEGKMVELDATSVLSIPRQIKSQEVVQHGFMSNFLFANISNVFGSASGAVRSIIEKMTIAQEEPTKKPKVELEQMDSIEVDEDGNCLVDVGVVEQKAEEVLGPKIYDQMTSKVSDALDELRATNDSVQVISPTASFAERVKAATRDAISAADNLARGVKATIKAEVVRPVTEDYGASRSVKSRVERQVDTVVDSTMESLRGDYKQKTSVAVSEHEKRIKQAETPEEVESANADFQSSMETITTAFTEATESATKQIIEEQPVVVTEMLERDKAQQEQGTIEEEIRKYLRGFARTIPSFLMAYGDSNLRLANFDKRVEPDVFLEVTGITIDEFLFLRDGGEIRDPSTGEMVSFAGNLFDEVVFNDSIKVFMEKRVELANYFEEGQTEDIFSYIPPQKTNQIFTPREVIQRTLDKMEEEFPGCFDNPNETFVDLYMKSGLYLTEIAKRLFSSEAIKKVYPNAQERIKHILEEQLYGVAPSRIIYLISTNFIFGFDDTLRLESKNFIEADSATMAKEGKLAEFMHDRFGVEY